MNQLNQRDIGLHVSILGWLYIVSSALMVVIGGMVFLLLTSIGAVTREPEALAILSIVGTWVGGVMVLLAVPGFLAGYGLLKQNEWGRILALVLAVLNLLNFPLGTLLGVYALLVLLQTSANDYFAATKPVPA
jgi:hypothetical protein